MSSGSRHAAIIGGGVIGTACAYFLAKAGWSVTILEKGPLGGGSSGGNCGLVCPSHVLPLAEPGMVAKGIASLFQKNSPLAIKFRLDPALWSWLIHFAMRCNERAMLEAGRGIQPLLESSLELYEHLIEQEHLACEWEQKGLLFAYRSKPALDAYTPTDRLLAETFHCPAKRFDGKSVLDLEPALKPGLAGGWYYADDAHLRPDRLLSSWRRVLDGLGVRIVENTSFLGFRRQDARAVTAEVDGQAEDVAADAFVVATGAWTPVLNQALDAKIPIQPGKGYSMTMPRPKVCPAIPIIFPETRVAVTPFHSGYRIGSTMEFSGYDTSIDPSRLQLLRDGAAPYLQEPECEPIEETWYGWRPMTWDSLPIIDRSPTLKNVVIAAGHNMLGLSMAPATGRLVAEILSEQPTFLDVKPYRVSRF